MKLKISFNRQDEKDVKSNGQSGLYFEAEILQFELRFK